MQLLEAFKTIREFSELSAQQRKEEVEELCRYVHSAGLLEKVLNTSWGWCVSVEGVPTRFVASLLTLSNTVYLSLRLQIQQPRSKDPRGLRGRPPQENPEIGVGLEGERGEVVVLTHQDDLQKRRKPSQDSRSRVKHYTGDREYPGPH